jgi:serine/threonine protein kinase
VFLGHYQIQERLGAGGMGAVYRARDAKLGREVAIKILPDAFASDAERVARFTREGQTLATLSHPHIAQIHDSNACAPRQIHPRSRVRPRLERFESSSPVRRIIRAT